MQNKENITTLSNPLQRVEQRNNFKGVNSPIPDHNKQVSQQKIPQNSQQQKQNNWIANSGDMSQQEALRDQEIPSSLYNGQSEISYQQMVMNLHSQKHQNEYQYNNVSSQPCQAMQKDLQMSQQGKKQVYQSNMTQNSLSLHNFTINGGINTQFGTSDQFQFTQTHTEHSSQNGYFASIQGIGGVATNSDEQNVIVNNPSTCNNPQSLFQNNESVYSANSKSLEVSNYHYRNGQNECPRIDYQVSKGEKLGNFDLQPSYIPISYNQQPSLNQQQQQQQQQQWDNSKALDEQRFYSKNYDSILENLGRKIENIAKIAKESEKHEIEIKKYISNENSLEYMITSPNHNNIKQSSNNNNNNNNNEQIFNNSDSKDFQDMLLQDTDNKNNLLTNRSNSNQFQLTNRTYAQSISTLYNLNNNNNHVRHNSSSSLPLTERDRTLAMLQQFDLPSQRSFAKNPEGTNTNRLHLASCGIDNLNNNNYLNNDEGSLSSRPQYNEYPSNMMITQKNGPNDVLANKAVKKKETDLGEVSKRLEDLLKNEGEDSDYVFYNNSVYSQCPHIYSTAKYIIFTQSDFEKMMRQTSSENETVISQQQRILKLEETISNLTKKQETFIEYQKEILAKNNQLQENNATLLRTLGNISTEKAAQQLKDGYKLQNYSSGQSSNLSTTTKKQSELQSISKEVKQSSQSYHISSSNHTSEQEKRSIKLSVIGDNKENQQKGNNTFHDQNKSANCSQTTTQLHTPNTKLIKGTSNKVGVTTTTQTKKQNVMGESQYFSKESSHTFNTEHYTSCDIEENKSTEPAHADSMSMIRQKTEEEELIGNNSNNNQLNYHGKSIGSLTSVPSQKTFQNQSLNQSNNQTYFHSNNQSLNHQNSVQNLNNTQYYINDQSNVNTTANTIQGYLNSSSQAQMMIQSSSGNNILVKNKPPIQPKHKGTILIKDFLQQDSQSNLKQENSRDLLRGNSCDINLEGANSSQINIQSIERTSMENKKLSATKLLKSKIIMNQQISQEQIQKQLQEKQHILVEQLQSLTRNDEPQTVNTKLSSTNISQLNTNGQSSQSSQPSNVINSLTNGLAVNNNHILKISPSFLKNKVLQQPTSSNSPSLQNTNNIISHTTHSKSIDSYSMQQTKKPLNDASIPLCSQSPFTQGVRASVLAGKTASSQQQSQPIVSQPNTSIKQTTEQENTKHTKKEAYQIPQKNSVSSKQQDNVKKSNIGSMNYHLSGSIGNNQNNGNTSVNYGQSFGSSQQNLSIEEFSSTSSRGKKGLSAFYIGGATNSTNEQSQIPSTNRIPKANSTSNNAGGAPLMTSFSQHMHSSSQQSSFMNNDSVIPPVNKTTMNKNEPQSQGNNSSQHSSVNHESCKTQNQLQSQQPQQFNQSQKMGQTTLLLKQITKSQPRQLSANPHNPSGNNTTSGIQLLGNNSNSNTQLNPTKTTSYSLDKTARNTTSIQNVSNNPQYNFKISLNSTLNKPDNQQSNINNIRTAQQHLGSTQITSHAEKRKSGSLTQRGTDYNEKPFDLKSHILQNQKERQELEMKNLQQQKEAMSQIDNMQEESRGLEKRAKHTNSVPHFSSLSIAGKAQTARGIQGVENNNLLITRQNANLQETKSTLTRPSSLNSGQQRHFTSLNDQSEASDKTLKNSQYLEGQKYQIMTERIVI